MAASSTGSIPCSLPPPLRGSMQWRCYNHGCHGLGQISRIRNIIKCPLLMVKTKVRFKYTWLILDVTVLYGPYFLSVISALIRVIRDTYFYHFFNSPQCL